ncbi:hypothetical protein B0T10DRAFT_556534 [Thelonectria olida]|uniref:Uncharacterized protein n=1 Tax=Thelonectria olida TaxID=1576542 RepID=A0A9P8WGV3_9HYPO|nr:hypothetical protein B0T10DRAFT_556534 [Thelonectria olida]
MRMTTTVDDQGQILGLRFHNASDGGGRQHNIMSPHPDFPEGLMVRTDTRTGMADAYDAMRAGTGATEIGCFMFPILPRQPGTRERHRREIPLSALLGNASHPTPDFPSIKSEPMKSDGDAASRPVQVDVSGPPLDGTAGSQALAQYSHPDAPKTPLGRATGIPFDHSSLIGNTPNADAATSEDLRLRHTGLNRFRAISLRLLSQPPMVFEPEARDTSGLDCMVRFLQYANYLTLAHGGSAKDAYHPPSGDENPILTYSYRDFGRHRGGVALRNERIKAKQQLLDMLEQHVAGPDLSFDSIDYTPLMVETLWSLGPWDLAQSNMIWNGRFEGPWQIDRFDAQKQDSLLDFDCQFDDKKDLQTFIDDFFRPSFRYNPPYEILITNSSAQLVRIRYRSHAVRPWPIERLREFEMPIASFSTDGERERVSWDTTVTFVLVAVVRLRDDKHGKDYIRTYGLSGCRTPMHDSSPSFMKGDWSLKDLGSKEYTLLYAKRPGATTVVLSEE